MADAQPKNEAVGVGLGQCFLAGGHRDGISGIDVRNPGGDYDSPGSRQQDARVSERFASGSFAKPNGAEAELFQFRRRLLGPGGGTVLELPCPDSDGSELYR